MKKSNNKDEKEIKTIAYLRSTELFNDSRAIKEIESYSLKYNVIAFGWNRNSANINLNNSVRINYKFFKKSAKYGSGIKNIFNILKFNKWLIIQMNQNIDSFDVIHACDLDTAIAARYIAKKYKKKLIYDIYDYYSDCHNLGILKKAVEWIDINIINKADIVLICTEKRKKQIAKANPKRIEIIHNSPKLKLGNVQKNTNNKINIGYFGILQDDRLLIEIANEIIKNDKLIFHVGGFGKYESYFKKLANEFNNIKYYGQLKYEDVLKKEQNCDVLFATYNPIVPNHKYSAPNKVYEAMALNLPIIVCKDTGIDELVLKEKIGYAIDYNAQSFINTVKLIKKGDFINNNKVFEKKYSWYVMEEKLLKIISEL